MLDDKESFVYLAAVHALSRLIDMNRKLLFPICIEIFSGQSNPIMNLKIRAALGEVLSISIRRAHEIGSLFIPNIVKECLKICRIRVYLPSEDDLISVNLSKMEINLSGNSGNNDIDTKNDNEIKEMNEKIEMMTNSANLFYLRQSSYSLLSEAIACGGWTVMKYINDTLDLAIGTLLHEQNYHPFKSSSSEPLKKSSQSQMSQFHSQSSDRNNHHPSHIHSLHQENNLIRRCSIFLLKYHLIYFKDKIFSLLLL